MSESPVAMKQTLPVSIVIATLGGDVLKSTLAQLNAGEAVPAEILIAIPEAESGTTACVAFISNVHVIKTACRGQVAQRAEGLARANYPYVMQMDDDVFLPSNTLKVLFGKLIEKGPKNVIAPFFRLQPNGEDGTRYIGGFRGFIRNCHASLICGAAFGSERLGRISRAGIGFGVPKLANSGSIVESEWLPGGVALCHKEDLITTNYYPFPGKAFSEDLIHSILWRKAGCRLWTVLDVSALIDVTTESFNWKSVVGRYRAHSYVAGLSGGSIWRTRIWFVCYCLWNMKALLLAVIKSHSKP